MKKRLLFLFFMAAVITQCGPSLHDSATRVEIDRNDSGYELLVNDQPFFIKGAVAWQKFDLIAEYGGNSIRTSARKSRLDHADSLGLKVLVNLPVRSERDGMDYEDTAAVNTQFRKVIALVEEFKDHPAVMIWSLGNELDWIPPGLPYNRKIWTEVNRISEKIHEIDPHHPTLTVVGSANEKKIGELNRYCPDLDLVGLNEYGDILDLPANLRKWGWERPYVLTEWGPTGFWQVPVTDWDVPIEETSSEKADIYKLRYEEAIMADSALCLGSFVFLWNQHQERTHTWFGMFDEQWRETEAVDVMRYEWTGQWPENRAPGVDSMLLDRQKAIENVRLAPGSGYTASIYTRDPDGDPLEIKWEVLKEGTEFPYGGNGEQKGDSVPVTIEQVNKGSIRLSAPEAPGPYRLFVYIYDGNNHFSTANIPFLVEDPRTAN